MSAVPVEPPPAASSGAGVGAVPGAGMAAALPLSDVEKALRMGADPRSMNLAALRTRALMLHAKLDEFHRRLAATPPGATSWCVRKRAQQAATRPLI